MLALEQVRTRLEQLGLNTVSEILEARLDLAAQQQQPYTEFLAELLNAEVIARQQHQVVQHLKLAHFPFERTLESFDFGFQPSVDKRLFKELSSLAFLGHGQNIVLLGPPGVGKTHLAVGLGRKVIEAGFGVLFVKANALVEDLRKAQLSGHLERRLALYIRPKLLIIDEFGVWPYDRLAATALFALIAARYERNPTIMTSNKGFADWGEVMGDAVVATAILDRLLHHSHVINIRGDSFRLREKKQAGLFSGIKPREVITP